MSGDDDVQVAGFTTNVQQTLGEDTIAPVELNVRDLVVAGTEQFYVTVGGLANADETRHAMRVEKVA